LSLSRELVRRPVDAFGTPGHNPGAEAVPDAPAALNRLALPLYKVDDKTTIGGGSANPQPVT
jgi:hypothetical protein